MNTGQRIVRMWRRISLKGKIGLGILLAVVTAAAFAPFLAPHDPNQQDLMSRVRPPFWSDDGTFANLLGTDRLGRDILSRILYGAQLALLIASCSVVFSGILGTAMGLMAGYFGGLLGTVIMRLVDIVLAIPFILLALVVMSVLGPSLLNLTMTFVVTRWVQYARISYAQALAIREADYVQACKAIGVSQVRVVFRHVLPNALGPLMIVGTLELGFVILMESGLSFLGLGIPPEIASWGGMLQNGRAYINIAWWLTTFPGLAIVLTVMGFNFVGDWLRDQLDPRLDVSPQ